MFIRIGRVFLFEVHKNEEIPVFIWYFGPKNGIISKCVFDFDD